MTNSPMNFYPLGNKGVFGELDKCIGQANDFQDTSDNAVGLKNPATGIRIEAVLVRSTSATPLAPRTCVKWDTAAVGTAVSGVTGAGEMGAGIVDPFLTTNVAQNELFYMLRKGRVKIIAGAAFTAGAVLMPAASGRLIAATADVAGLTARCARACEAAAAAADVRFAYLEFTL